MAQSTSGLRGQMLGKEPMDLITEADLAKPLLGPSLSSHGPVSSKVTTLSTRLGMLESNCLMTLTRGEVGCGLGGG